MESRRNFLKKLALSSAMLAAGVDMMKLTSCTSSVKKRSEEVLQDITSETAPLWKGFNLLNKFNPDKQTPFSEKDFEIMAEWGFNFVRLPLSYWCWSSEDDWYSINEKVLDEISQAVEFGKQYGLHVNLNFHRVPGYCINNPKPKTNLFENEEALKACAFHWKVFAERFKGVPNRVVSFNLINEAPAVSAESYDKVARSLISTIRDVDPNRLIIVDGKDVGRVPLMTLKNVPNIIQSGRGYDPMLISHFRAGWPGIKQLMEFPEDNLDWPFIADGRRYDKEYLLNESISKWKEWTAAGGKVHIGEMGCFNRTPHKVALAWLEDVFSLFNEQGWGWSLWNLQGDFGVLDSGRKDVKYENYKGYKLDREMLELLKRS